MGILKEGTYEDGLKIIGTRVEEHKENEPKFIFVLTTPDAQEGDDSDIISDFLYTSDKAWDAVTSKRLKSYGWDGNVDGMMTDLNNGASSSYIGRIVKPVVIKKEMYEGKAQYKIARVGDETFGSQLGDAELKSIETAFQRRIRLRTSAGISRAVDTLPAAPPPVPVAATASEDIPF